MREAFKKLFGINQKMNTGEVKDSVIIQSTDKVDVTVINQVPREFVEKLTSMESMMKSVIMPRVLETTTVIEVNNAGEELYRKLISNTIEEIHKSIDAGRLAHAQSILSELQKANGFEGIYDDHKAQIYYYQGLVFVNQKLKDEANGCQIEINKLSGQS